ncbi:hypothetical protein WDU94_011155 [Cyamophila willieti]
MKLCANKSNTEPGKNINVKYVSNITGKPTERSSVNGQMRDVNGRQENDFRITNRKTEINRANDNILGNISEVNGRPVNMFETNEKTGQRLEMNSRHVERIDEHFEADSRNIGKSNRNFERNLRSVERNDGKLEGNSRHVDRVGGNSLMEVSNDIVVPEEMVLLLETVKTQSEALSKLLQGPAKNTNANHVPHDINSKEQQTHVCEDSQIRNQPRSSLKTSDGCVNDENTICDRCGSEVILKFHINDSKQQILSRSDKSVQKPHGKPDIQTLGEKNNLCNHENNVQQQTTRYEEMNSLQNQMSDLMTRFESLSTRQKQGNISTNQNQGNIWTNQNQVMNREWRNDSEPFSPYKTQVLDKNWRVSNQQSYSQDSDTDPVDLSCQTLARLESQITALDESLDKYRRDNIRKEAKFSPGENMDLSQLNNLLSTNRTLFSSEPRRYNTVPKQRDHSYQPNILNLQQPLQQRSSYRLPLLNPTMSNQTTSPYQNNSHHLQTPGFYQSTSERQNDQKPPYFSSNVPFWQSYLKTHAFPPNKKKSWQDHFQDFANHVDQSDEHMGRDKNGEDLRIDRNGLQSSNSGDADGIGRDNSDGRKIINVNYDNKMEIIRNEPEPLEKTPEKMEPLLPKTYQTTGIVTFTTEQQSIHRTETINSQINKMNSLRNNKHAEKIDKRKVGVTDQIKEQENNEMEHMEVMFEKQIKPTEPEHIKAMQVQNKFEATFKKNISQGTIDSNKESCNQEKEHVNSSKDILGQSNVNNPDKSQYVSKTEDTFRETKDKGLEITDHYVEKYNTCEDNIGELNNSKKKTEGIMENTDLKQSEDAVEVNNTHVKKTEEPNDNLIVEYNTRGSLLFQIQDSDENRRTHPTSNKTLPSDSPPLLQETIGLSTNTTFQTIETQPQDNITIDFKTPLPLNRKESLNPESKISKSHSFETDLEPLKSPKTNLSFKESPRPASVKSAETNIDDDFEIISIQMKFSPIKTTVKSPPAVSEWENIDELISSNPLNSPAFISDGIDHANESLLKPLKSPNVNLSSHSVNSRVVSSFLSQEEDSKSELSVYMSSQAGNGDDDW